MKFLALTTATSRFGAALLDDEDVVASDEHDEEMKHAERLFPAVDGLLARVGWRRQELDALACDVGPGSFTGVRVGLASAKGMALALGVPLCPVGSLEAMAAAAFALAPPEAMRIACLLDARRGELFVAVYRRDLEAELAPEHVLSELCMPRLDGLAAAPPLLLCGRVMRGVVASERYLDDPSCELPSAAWIGKIAAGRLGAPPPELDLIEPVYVRGPDAKLPTRR
jgi:tRNA threonylcarbamoyladenosine biosynthesis protein TsaB